MDPASRSLLRAAALYGVGFPFLVGVGFLLADRPSVAIGIAVAAGLALLTAAGFARYVRRAT